MQREISKHMILPALDATGIKDFFLDIPHSTSNYTMDNGRAMNSPETITECFDTQIQASDIQHMHFN